MKALLLLLAVVPLWIVDLPPIQDLPNHLGRVHVLLDLLGGGAAFGGEYAIQWLPLPNIGADLLLLPLLGVLPVAVAGKVFLSFVIVLTGLAGFRFFAAAGAPEMGWLALPLLWNWFVHMGFLSFLLGVPIALYAAAYRMEREDRWGTREHVVFALLATSVYFAHLFAFAFLAAFVQLRKMRRGRFRDLFRIEPGLLPALLLFAILMLREREGPGWFWYDHPEWKLWTLANLFRVHFPPTDLAFFALSVAGTVFATRRVRRDHLPAVWLALALFLALPRSGLGGYWIDARVLIFLAYLLLAALRADPVRAKWIGAALLVLSVLSTGVAFRVLGPEIGRMVRSAESLPPGARIVPVSEKPAPGQVEVYHHAVTWLVSLQDAVTPYLFAKPFQHPVRALKDRPVPHEYWFQGRGDPPDAAALARDWDYAWCTARWPIEADLLKHGTLTLTQDDLRIFRLAGSR